VSRTPSRMSSRAASPLATEIEQRRRRIQELQTKLHQQSSAVLQQKMPARSSSSSNSRGYAFGSHANPGQKTASRSSYGQLPTTSRRNSQSYSGSVIAVGPRRHSTSTSVPRRTSNSSTGSIQRGVTPGRDYQEKTSLLNNQRDLFNVSRTLSYSADLTKMRRRGASTDGCDVPAARGSAAVGDPSFARMIAALRSS
jgi:hypothetical protein